MKQFLKYAFISVVLAIVSIVALFTLFFMVPSPQPPTKEQQAARAAERAAAQIALEKEEAEDAVLRAEAKAMHAAIIAEESPKFLAWLTTEGHCLRARFTDDNALEVEWPRLLIPTPEDARVRAEEVAERWAIRAGLDRVTVSVYYGNEVYAEGIYSAGVPKLYLLKTAALKAAKDRTKQGLPELAGQSWHEVTTAHGAPLSQSVETGWAVWPAFKVRFVAGTAQEVATP